MCKTLQTYKIVTITHATFAFRNTASFVWERIIVLAAHLGKEKDPTGEFVCLAGYIHAFTGVVVVIRQLVRSVPIWRSYSLGEN